MMNEIFVIARKRSGLTLAQLSKKTNIPAHQIKMYELGVKDFHANNLLKLFKGCGFLLCAVPLNFDEGEE